MSTNRRLPMLIKYRILAVLTLVVLANLPVLAQVTTGTPPFGSFAGGPDTIDLANLNVHYSFPVLQKAGRGLPFNYALTYDSSVWTPASTGTSGGVKWTNDSTWGWSLDAAVVIGYLTPPVVTHKTQTCIDDSGKQHQVTFTVSTYRSFRDPMGAVHPVILVLISGSGICGLDDSSAAAYTKDGSGWYLSVPDGTATSSTGRVYELAISSMNAAGSLTDRNGNQISTTDGLSFTDTLGQNALTISGGAPNPLVHSYTSPTGTSQYKVIYTSQTVQTAFGCSTVGDYGPLSNSLVSEIDLPDISVNSSDKYTFVYETTPGDTHTPHYVTGRIASITLPTGGTISYTYTGGNSGINCADGSTTGFQRFTPDTGTAYWNYARTAGTGSAYTTTITDPTSSPSQTVIQFQGLYETERQTYQGSASSGTLLNTLTTCYNGNTTNCPSTAIILPITQRNITTVLPGASSLTSQSIYKYNSTGSLKEQDDYDYGSGTVGALLKTTIINYATLSGITAFRSQVTVKNGTGAIVSQINYNYGDTVTATGAPQHIAPYGSRGNLLSVNYYTNGSTYLTKSYTYFDTGKVQTATDANGAQTTYTYGACGNSFPTGVTEPLSLSRSITWDCNGGVRLTTKDENLQTTTVTYSDPYFWRPASSSDPTSAVTSYTYTGQNEVESVLPIVSGSAADSLSVTDKLGRLHLSQIRQTPGGSSFDTTESDPDVEGRPAYYKLPFGSTAGQGRSGTPSKSTYFDALGRVTTINDAGGGSITNVYSQNDVTVTRGPAPTGENTKKHQSQYDALGRLTSVCEMSSATGSGTCGQTTPQTGYWTKYTYDPLGRLTGLTQNAQSGSTQSRSYAYDLLGRMTSETEAESGTTAYTYDTDSTCATTSSGDLVKRVDAVGNVTCYSYDLLHRPLSITYPSGSYSSKTPNKYFVYDSATVNGVAMTNGKMRVVEAYTATTQGGTKITDAGFSYTVRGESSDIYEKTPNSGGYYHVSELFYANGAPKQLSGLSSLPTFTYTLDGEGRVFKVSASPGQNPVTNTAFNNASLATSITFGSTDTDSFTYDSNTDRMTQYQFTVNGQSLTGALTWNANATLQTLGLTDLLNSADTQSCAYAYDDLMRITSANCGSVWSQTFSYDAFGNISKSGSVSFAALYSSSTNRITSVGSFNPTYDANGNILSDPAHTYSWDSVGKPVTIDTVNMTYDALGRMVEQNRSGAYTQFVYGPHGGKFAIMSGQTLQKAFIPLVGGAQAVYNASGLLYYGHSDHLGSVRLGSTSVRGVSFDLAYAPFGEIYASSGSTDPAFTGQRQDTVSGVYDFPAREYSNEGRWASPDPSGSAAFQLTDPQSLNRYAYVRNTPMSLVDPTGLLYVNWEEAGCWDLQCSGIGGAAATGSSPGGGPTGIGNQGGYGDGCASGQQIACFSGGIQAPQGDPSNSAKGCNPGSATCGPPAPPDISLPAPLCNGCLQVAPTPPPTAPPAGVMIVNVNQNDPNVPMVVTPGVIINGTLTTSDPLSSGTATATVSLYKTDNPAIQAPSSDVGIIIGIPNTNAIGAVVEPGAQPTTQLSLQVPTASTNGSFGFTGNGTLAIAITDSQGNTFQGNAQINVDKGPRQGQDKQFLINAGQTTFTVP
jgi:RHS repeat-associated protein